MLLGMRLEVEEGAEGEIEVTEVDGVDVGGEIEGGGEVEGDMVEFKVVKAGSETEMEGVGDIDSGVEVRFGELVEETPRLWGKAPPSGSEPTAVLGVVLFVILCDERGSGFCSLRKWGRSPVDGVVLCEMISPACTDSELALCTLACCRQRSWGLTNSQGGSYKGF
jgi:hypothetical protein